ncbi:restriction endonuclease subunit R [Wenzhouxiangella sp. EGI_FJ10409]|uniref:restriction endonuclease subunit R n=1 Tax=Wenzhouxiangella sp. EGI_FJ10409 TaxID=3243767 RepID=UPI0035E30F37
MPEKAIEHLHQRLAERIVQWRKAGYPSESWPTIAEILRYAWVDGPEPQLRYLRQAQLVALETYWYLRVVLDTPSIPQLYEQLYNSRNDRLAAMGISPEVFADVDFDFEALQDRIATDNAFVRTHKLESLRETLSLDYPSYILALAMGAGKTILIGTIVATEFAMAEEYPEGPFVQNALVFAPGKTIIESLREIADIPFDRILPERMYKPFAAALKLTFTRDGDKELSGVVWGSRYNVVVTNTEKIRIQKSNRRKAADSQLALPIETEDHDAEIANLRLQAIASLPNLAIFSDEAHHTYGQKLLGKWVKDPDTGEREFKADGIKKVRRTVDYLARETSLKVVVNTTGTPYFERQPLRDVVVWYGLGEGIRDGILKEVANNIQVFDLDGDDIDDLLTRIVHDFVDHYWSVRADDGSPARIALYFPQTDVMDKARPVVESALALKGIDPTVVLPVHANASKEQRDAFFRVGNDPDSPYRIMMLVNMGTEGWNCPSLFATALVRKLKTSNNFVLQAATRCLRQVPGNEKPARIYLTQDNRKVLEKQLQETYGTTIQELGGNQAERVHKEITLRKWQMPPVYIKKQIARYRRKESAQDAAQILALDLPDLPYQPAATMQTWTIAQPKVGAARMTRVDSNADEVSAEPPLIDCYTAASQLAANYHLKPGRVLQALRAVYRDENGVPEHHLEALSRQIENQCSDYEQEWEELDVALALVKPDGFATHQVRGRPVYTAHISFAKDRAHLYKLPENLPDAERARERSFHYEGYNFDSAPESEYLERVLALLGENADNIAGVWFTGGLTDPNKTDLFAEYRGEDGRWHRYTPDFVIQRKDGKHLVVEIKSDRFKADVNRDLERHGNGKAAQTAEGRKAVALRKWQDLNPGVLHYEVIFADDGLAINALDETRRFVSEQ